MVEVYKKNAEDWLKLSLNIFQIASNLICIGEPGKKNKSSKIG